MAPSKFGLFKGRSREQAAEQPSTENLLQCSPTDPASTPGSPVPSTSKINAKDDITLSNLTLDTDDDDIQSEAAVATRRISDSSSRLEDVQGNYHPLMNTDVTSTSTLQDDYDDVIDTESQHQDIDDDASTSCDANSIQFDQTSIAPSEDMSVYCAAIKKPKKTRSREERQMRDLDMWQASNIEVMQNLLRRSGTLDDQIKWEAIATARGLCTLTDNCTCGDCNKAKYLAGITDGDGGLGAAPLFNAISLGCQIQ